MRELLARLVDSLWLTLPHRWRPRRLRPVVGVSRRDGRHIRCGDPVEPGELARSGCIIIDDAVRDDSPCESVSAWLSRVKVGDADPCGRGVVVRLIPGGYVSEIRGSPLLGALGRLGLGVEVERDFQNDRLNVDSFKIGEVVGFYEPGNGHDDPEDEEREARELAATLRGGTDPE